MRILFVLALLVTASAHAQQPTPPLPGAHAQDRATPQPGPRTFYDAQGRIAGTAETSGAVTTFRDPQGRLTGTAERLADGRVEYRDAQGRLTGTSQ